MPTDELESLRYPIGTYTPPQPITAEHVRRWTRSLAELPAALRAAVGGLDERALETPYRPGGWSVRQVVHHVADSHVIAWVRFKWALTEVLPPIRAYDEAAWARLPDVARTPIGVSLDLLDALHARWVALVEGLAPDELAREYVHPELGPVRLDRAVGMYDWHGRHHLAHVTRLAEREGWRR